MKIPKRWKRIPSGFPIECGDHFWDSLQGAWRPSVRYGEPVPKATPMIRKTVTPAPDNQKDK